LTDVSWTNLRISAFPGIVWARSIREAVQFARSRIFPSPEALRELHEGTTATMPQTPYVGWYRNSHLRRIFRWTFSRPPRVQTMNSIHNLLSAERSRG
jgi:hypothetical protein